MQKDIVLLGRKGVGKTALAANLSGHLGLKVVDFDQTQHNYCLTSWLDNSDVERAKVKGSKGRLFDTDGAATIEMLSKQRAESQENEQWSDEALYVVVMGLDTPRNQREDLQLLKEITQYGDSVVVVAEGNAPSFNDKFMDLTTNNPWVLPVPFKNFEPMNDLYENGSYVGVLKGNTKNNPLIENISAIADALSEYISEEG